MSTSLSQKRAAAPPDVVIPDRLYFKIGDVAEICGLETYVLRFWESQFPQLKPTKSGTGQRLYRRREVELVLEIKRLVHSEGYTLAGARQAMEEAKRREQVRLAPEGSQTGPRIKDVSRVIANARNELREIMGLLASPDPQASRRRGAKITAIAAETESLFPS